MTTLREAAQQALDELSYWRNKVLRDEADFVSDEYNETITTIRAALAEPVQEPVAWYFEARHIDSAWAAAVTLKHPGPEGKYMRKVTPLYTAPPQRKPLTEEEIDSIWDSEKAFADIYAITRAIERAHGIGGQP